MEDLVRWFLKTNLQHEQLLAYDEPEPNQGELYEFILQFDKLNPDIVIEDTVQKLKQTMIQVSDSMIVPPLIYEQVMQMNNSLTQSLYQKFKLRSDRRYEPSDFEYTRQKFQNQLQRYQKRHAVINKKPPIFQDHQHQAIYQTRRYIVQAFVQKGYGMQLLRQYLVQYNLCINIQYKSYAGVINSIATEGFRSMEKFLKESCGVMVDSINKAQLRILYPILLNLKKFVKPEEYKIFTLFLTSIYNIGPQSRVVSALQVYNVYQAILRLLKIRLKEVEQYRVKAEPESQFDKLSHKKQKIFCVFGQYESNKPSTAHKWNKQSEAELVQIYQLDQQLGKIRERYREKYGCITLFQDVNVLRSQLYKIIRKTLRQVQKISQYHKDKFNEVIRKCLRLNDKQRYIQFVMTSPQFVNVRLALCRYYQKRDLNMINEIAKQIQISFKERERKESYSQMGRK